MTESQSDSTEILDTETQAEEGDVTQEVFVVPTSHVSETSSGLVKETIQTTNPDIVALELDEKRLQRLQQKLTAQDSGVEVKEYSTRDILTTSTLPLRARLLFAGIYKLQSSIQNKLPIDITGQDMSAGLTTAEELELPVETVDREFTETLTRLSSAIPPMQLAKLLITGVLGYIQLQRKDEKELQEQVEVENIDEEEITKLLETQLPTVKSVFIDERDKIIAKNTADLLLNKEYSTVVLVIGSAHKNGVVSHLQELVPTAEVQVASE